MQLHLPALRTCARLVQARLLHDSQELLLVDLAIAIAVGLVDHLLELLVRHVLAELLGDALEVLERNLCASVREGGGG